MVNSFDDRIVQLNFERAAASYARGAVIQREIEDRLLERLENIHDPRVILDLGCGPGRGTLALGARYPNAAVIAIDTATSMVRRTKTDVPAVNTVCADARLLPLRSNSVDFVFTSSMLQWFQNLDPLFDELRRVMSPRAVLLFSSLGPDTLGELKASWRAANTAVHVHDFLDMHDVGDALVSAGFLDPVLEAERITLHYQNARQLMRDLKDTGSRNASVERNRSLTGKSGLRRMLEQYEHYRVDGRIPATYEVIYGYARAPEHGQPRRTADGIEAAISVEALRNTIKHA